MVRNDFIFIFRCVIKARYKLSKIELKTETNREKLISIIIDSP